MVFSCCVLTHPTYALSLPGSNCLVGTGSTLHSALWAPGGSSPPCPGVLPSHHHHHHHRYRPRPRPRALARAMPLLLHLTGQIRQDNTRSDLDRTTARGIKEWHRLKPKRTRVVWAPGCE
ncbi:hypothetical protein F5883DRAFT_550772 [Diaporthe sp. PMI_573]|nr:hypothetical protein F5883DRAFT_550772 [Diaporthaceae sp. PMI_573]